MAASLKDRSPRWLKSGADQLTRRYAMATVADRPAPDFLIIGTKRGGTTSLFNYLLQHPGILGLYPQNRGKKSTDYFFKELPRGDAWYRSHFHSRTYRATLRKRLGYTPVGGEASPYYMWDPRIAPLVVHAAPQVKAIALVRDPVERAYSHYQERKQNGVERLDQPPVLGLFYRFGHIHTMTRIAQAAHHHITQHQIVFDHKNSHAPDFAVCGPDCVSDST